MRALTMDELEFVSGGEDDPAEIVTVTGVPNGPTPGWGVLYPEDLALTGQIIGDYISTGEFSLTNIGNNAQKARIATFLANTTRTVNSNGTVTVTFNVPVSITGNVPLFGTYQFSGQAGDRITGTDKGGGARGGPNGIPDLLDKILNSGATIRWG
jgi:hypothetical protein